MYLYGASGHAKVVIDLLGAVGIPIDGLVDDNLSIQSLDGFPVRHNPEGLQPFIVTIGNCLIRKRVVERLGNISFGMAIHPSVIMSRTVFVGEGSVIMAGAILQTGVSVGRHSIVNTGASVDHDCLIGDFVHIAPHCTLCGEVTVEECSWIGAGTTIIQGIHIGKNCFIGAGSVVVEDIPDNVLAYGNPCKVIRRIE